MQVHHQKTGWRLKLGCCTASCGRCLTCWLTRDTKRIEAAILEATGYRLVVEQKAIQVNLNEAFDAHPDDTNNQIEKAQFLQ
jgi:hypothetical protein